MVRERASLGGDVRERERHEVNMVIAVVVGGVVGIVGTIGGVAAYQGSPDGVSQTQLYSYADN
jgi:hypothetical protein